MEFNKTVSSKRGSKEPSVVFRMLSKEKESDNDKYQGSFNTAAVVLFESDFNVQVVFSDEHFFVGFNPIADSVRKNKLKIYFGATDLFKELPLVVGKHYTLKIVDGIAVIDADEFNLLTRKG